MSLTVDTGGLKNELSALSPLMCFDACLGFRVVGIMRHLNQPAGRQYYVVHDVLNNVLSRSEEKNKPYHSKIVNLVNQLIVRKSSLKKCTSVSRAIQSGCA